MRRLPAFTSRRPGNFALVSKPVRYWLFKSEPECFSIRHLEAAPNRTTFWDGVRNFQARNFLRDEIRPGDRVLYYHSNAEPSAVAGTATVVRAGYPDHTAQDPKSDHYDPKHTALSPIWYMVDIRLDEIFPRELPLDELRRVPELAAMELLRKGSRLSVQPVRRSEFDAVLKRARAETVAAHPSAVESARPQTSGAGTTTRRGRHRRSG